jgi:hypothetical protein
MGWRAWWKLRRTVLRFLDALERRRQLRRYAKLKDVIPDDEFDPSLNVDVGLALCLDTEERQDYFRNLARRRELAHLKSLARKSEMGTRS